MSLRLERIDSGTDAILEGDTRFMAKIVDFRLTYLVRPHIVLTTSYGAEKQERAHILVALTDEMGVIGVGEVTPLSNFTGETARAVYCVLKEVILPEIIGFDSFDIAAVHQKIDRLIFGNNAAKCAVDCAFYDLMAKELGCPLYALLGGKTNRRVAINRHIGIMPLDASVSMAKKYTLQNYKSIKIKVGADIDAAAVCICAIRDAVGPDVKLRVDANNNLTYVQACQLIERTLACRLEFYEQLLPKWDVEGTRRLRGKYSVPFLLDESINSVQDAVRFACNGTADAFTIKLCKCGGLYPATQIAAVAHSFGLQIVVASTYDTHIGCSACLHLASALPNVNTACDLSVFATQPNQAKTDHILDGMHLQVGSAPGIGVMHLEGFPLKA